LAQDLIQWQGYQNYTPFAIFENRLVHYLTLCSVQFISTKLAEAWMSASCDMTVVVAVNARPILGTVEGASS